MVISLLMGDLPESRDATRPAIQPITVESPVFTTTPWRMDRGWRTETEDRGWRTKTEDRGWRTETEDRVEDRNRGQRTES